MKQVLRISLIIGLFLFGNHSECLAQSGPVVCNINYSYDAGGHRIKREYVCNATWGPGDNAPWPGNNGTLLTNVFPNPTTGVFTGAFSEPLSSASFLIYAANGAVVLQYNLQQQASMVTFDISAQVPGTYFLTISALDKVETYTIIKM